MNKLLSLFLILLTLFLGLFALYIFVMLDIQGYAGYCEYVEMPLSNIHKNVEVGILTFFIILIILVKTFNWLNYISKGDAYFALLLVLLNYATIAYKIIEFPRVLSFVK